LALWVCFGEASRLFGDELSIVSAKDVTPLETLATREIYRYVYLRTGVLASSVTDKAMPSHDCIVVARKDRPLVASIVTEPVLKNSLASLQNQEYLLKTIQAEGRRIVLVVGGDDVGTLYAAYRFAEHLGVRFYLHGDVIPDGHVALELPQLDERGKPLFALRGLQPFHDFLEGPDAWNVDDYKLYLSQMAKMRMNFIGLHTYSPPRSEPTVWIGPREDVAEDGNVRRSYPAQYANTPDQAQARWRRPPLETGAYAGGAAMIFDHACFAPDLMVGRCPRPVTPEDCNELFNRTGRMFREVFGYAHALGIKTCVGTELPLTIPKEVQDRLRAAGKDPARPEVIRSLYEGIFRRISKTYPLDYYWLWTCELWTWCTPKPEDVERVIRHIRLAQEAIDNVKPPFVLGTCGWVLGPPHDRGGLDKLLPKKSPLSCINQLNSFAPIDPAFATIHGRPLWAIPWMEHDSGMIAPQFWVGRTRYDAVDALRYGCTGLFGIHWRTKVIGPTIAALAQAGWSQPWAHARTVPTLGNVGSDVGAFPTSHIAGTDEMPVYQTVRYGTQVSPYRPPMWAYQIKVPNGVYCVTLKMVEPVHEKAGERTFDVATQGDQICFCLDIFAKVGKNRALDMSARNVRVTDGAINLFLCCQVDYPSVAGIVIQGVADPLGQSPARPYTRKINCGGPAWKDYQADSDAVLSMNRRTAPTDDFYRDWATASFGPSAADRIAAVFGKLEGSNIPTPADGCPGYVRINHRPWAEESRQYAFVGELESLRGRLAGAGNLDRFDYWLNTFRYMRTMAELGCARGNLDQIMARLETRKDPSQRRAIARLEALPLRKELATLWCRMIGYQLAAVGSVGEMGTIASLEQNSREGNGLLSRHDQALAAALGSPLTGDVQPTREYAGPARILLPTVRTSVAAGESLPLKVILLAPRPPNGGSLYWRPLGKGPYGKVPLAHVARAVYRSDIPAQSKDVLAIEYYVRATWDDGTTSVWPATAPRVNQSVVVHAPFGPGS
jgi:hypothetical protein